MAIDAAQAALAYANAAARKADASAPAGGAEAAQGTAGFGDALREALDGAVAAGNATEAQIAQSVNGTQTELVDVVSAITAAEMSLQTMVTVRDKVIAAYQDIMRMPI